MKMEMLALTIQELGTIAGTITVTIAAGYAVAKLPPVRFVTRRLVNDPIREFLTKIIFESNAESVSKMTQFDDYVRGHLGPNGETKPVHERLKTAEEYIGLSATRQRRMMDSMNIGIAESDADGNNTFVNKFLCDMLGIQPHDWNGRGWENFIHPDDRRDEISQFEEQTVSEHVYEQDLHEVRFLHSDGSVLTFQGRNYALVVDDKVIGWVAEIFPTDENNELFNAQEVMSRKLDYLTDHAAKLAAKVDAVQNAMGEAVFRSDAEGNTIDCNQAYLDLFRLDRDEMGTPKWITRLDPRGLEETLSRIEDAFKNHKGFVYDNKMRDDDIGKSRYLRFSGNPLFELGEFTGYVGTIVEITREEAHNLPEGID